MSASLPPPEWAYANNIGRNRSPFLRAPETAKAIFILVLAAAMGPMAAGIAFFGYRALFTAALAVGGCVVIESLYYRITRVPALHGRSHAYLTGVLLALTLPPLVPWYVPLVAAAFAIIIGKTIFGGVGHFLWQPALVGRLAVAVLFAQTIANPFPTQPDAQAVLSQERIVVGDLRNAGWTENYTQWRNTRAPQRREAILLTPPQSILSGLTRGSYAPYSALAFVPVQQPDSDEGIAAARPAVLMQLPPISDLLCGATVGGIGETCAILILISGLYLVYRNYVRWHLPACFILAAAAVVAFAPIQLQGPENAVISGWGPPGGWSLENILSPPGEWTLPPLLMEGLDVGFLYVCYQVLSGPLLLAAFFLAPEMTSRPVTSGGQLLFGIGGGATAMLLQLYTDLPIPAYIAVLMMNTFTPLIDAMWRPRVFGHKRFHWLRRS